jgi:hypothetical protein
MVRNLPNVWVTEVCLFRLAELCLGRYGLLMTRLTSPLVFVLGHVGRRGEVVRWLSIFLNK